MNLLIKTPKKNFTLVNTAINNNEVLLDNACGRMCMRPPPGMLMLL